MKKITLFIICFFLQIFIVDLCAAQSRHKIDSLEYTIASHPSHDTTLVNRLISLGNLLEDLNADSTIRVLNTALTISDSLHFEKGTATIYYNIGIAYGDKGDINTAIKDYKKSLDISIPAKNYTLTGSNYLNIGNKFRISGAIDSVMPNYEQAKKYFLLSDKKPDVATTLINIGSFYIDRGDLEKGLDNLLQAQKILEKTDSKRALGYVYVNIAVIKYTLKNDKEAEEYTNKAIAIFTEIGDKNGLAGAYSEMGDLKTDEKRADESLVYFKKALDIGNQLSNTQVISHNLGRIGNSYLILHKLDSAKFYFEKSLSVNKDSSMKEELFESYFGLANVNQDKKQYQDAFINYNKALAIAIEIEDNQRRSDVFKELSNTYSEEGNDTKAFEYYKKYIAVQDSIIDEDKANKLNEMSAKYESEKKEKEIAILTKDKQIQNEEIKRQKFIKNSFIAGLAVLLILSILFYNYYHTKQLLKLQTLRNRIASDLHDDVGSTLSSIAIFSELAKEQSKEVIPMLDSIGDSSRKMLDSMADIVWTINPENDNFEKIILRMRSFAYELLGAKKIDFEFNADDTVAKMKLPMDVRKNLYLIFKEAINNMVKYADADRAFFSISGTKNNLTMLIRDNGKGFDINKSSEGNGLKNMKKRAQEIGAKLLIESGAGVGTTIQFLLKTA